MSSRCLGAGSGVVVLWTMEADQRGNGKFPINVSVIWIGGSVVGVVRQDFLFETKQVKNKLVFISGLIVEEYRRKDQIRPTGQISPSV